MSFSFATDQYFAELKESEMKTSRLAVLREADPYIGKFLSQRWVNINILQLSEDEITSMKKQMEEEAAAAPPPEEEAAVPPEEEVAAVPPPEEEAAAASEDMGEEEGAPVTQAMIDYYEETERNLITESTEVVKPKKTLSPFSKKVLEAALQRVSRKQNLDI